jgi:phospholipase/carboxylesterase
LLVHGWTGDENVMWIFTRNLAGRFWLLAPRAPLAEPAGGYAWLPHRQDRWPRVDEFRQPSDDLLAALPEWAAAAGVPAETVAKPVHLMGFSQGAALSYALTAYHPERVGRIAALAGFLPSYQQADLWEPAFAHRLVYVAHGSRDEIVPVDMARTAVSTLQTAGADVTFCESDSGHKLSLNCLHGLEDFFE